MDGPASGGRGPLVHEPARAEERGRGRYNPSARKRGQGRGRGQGQGRGRGRDSSPPGRRPGGGGGGGGASGRGRGRGRDEGRRPTGPRPAPPALTGPDSTRPSYFTCRHTYEPALEEELLRSISSHALGGAEAAREMSVSSPHPGLVCLQHGTQDVAAYLPSGHRYEPTYALQGIPNCVVVRAESIKGLANAIMGALVDCDQDERAVRVKSRLMEAPRDSLRIHGTVPEMFRGQPDPPLLRRVTKISEELGVQLKKTCAAARPARKSATEDEIDGGTDEADEGERWVLQVLLLEPDCAVASLERCDELATEGPSNANCWTPSAWSWPNWDLPAGLARVDIEEKMPSSAYRKLLEALHCMGHRPLPSSAHPVIDLGACPGGWTAALRMMGCRVLSVDRSPLDDALMNDPMVEFVEGDAFTFVPPWALDGNRLKGSTGSDVPTPEDSWMVSDVIAYPERVAGLVEDFCGNKWVSHLIVTIKFQGQEVPWTDVARAEEVARKHGYACRTKHFFNNKNEVTLMAVHVGANGATRSGIIGGRMY